MRTLMILIIAGLVLMNLGSPEKMQEAGNNLVNIAKQLPAKVRQFTQAKADFAPAETMAAVVSPDFTDVGLQADIPASEVLGLPVTPETKLTLQTSDPTTTPIRSFVHQDHHSIEEIHAINASSLEILDRISANYP